MKLLNKYLALNLCQNEKSHPIYTHSPLNNGSITLKRQLDSW